MKSHTFKLKIYSEDVDSFGIVHHVNFLKFMERARQEWLYELGFKLNDLICEDVLFVVKHAELDYFLPARNYDELIIYTAIQKATKVSTIYEQHICSALNEETVYCRGLVQVVCVNSKLRPRALPSKVMEKLL